MKKEAIHPDPGYYSRYISYVPDLDMKTVLEQTLQELQALDIAKLESLGNYAYAPGKWTLKGVFQHITDTERVFAYRAMMFARQDRQVPPSMDQDLYADHAEVDHRSMADILEELILLRKATIAQFNSYTDTALLRTGMCWQTEMSVLALGFTIAGHQLHHMDIIRQRYLSAHTNMEVSS
ncbi:DinB family protein [Chitinophaga sp. 22321]|uniref:DinB family protein n=1 Tax=Chitinophaga hostae TaxID=2831022 RepID=A0ABS5J7X7_9BACT|nr:DinB family protein [Chitinophaga hostae]MBS0031323.1 DinB family protein [Chitinophaga hostae]